MKSQAQILAGMLCFAALAAIPAQASTIKIYISKFGVQNTEVTGTAVENFDNMTAGIRISTTYVSSIGTYTSSSPFDVSAPDQYGGATDPTSPVNPTKYFVIGSQSNSPAPVTLALNQPADYFGFWLSAMDANNGVSFYSGKYLLTRFSSQMLIDFLNAASTANGGPGYVTAMSGSHYTTSSYYGNPNSGANENEPYVFVDFVAQGSVKFDKVVFDNSNSIGTGFESDNHTISAAAAIISNDHVVLGSVEADTPEPAAAILIASGLLLIALGRRRGLGALRPR